MTLRKVRNVTEEGHSSGSDEKKGWPLLASAASV